MHTDAPVRTPLSLLQRLRHQPDPQSWRRFVDLYTPLLFQFALRHLLSRDLAEELVQEMFVTLLREMPTFDYDPQRRFRGWLFTIFTNKVKEYHRRAALDRRADDADLCHLSAEPIPDFSEAEFNARLVQRAAVIMRDQFEESTWQAFWLHVVDERRPQDVAAELEMSVEAVYQAKSRVLRRLRRELDGMME
jgi:RNA polymerase sigma-70 factor (ECF subfamily)